MCFLVCYVKVSLFTHIPITYTLLRSYWSDCPSRVFFATSSVLVLSSFLFFLKMESKLFAYLPPPPHPDSAGLKAILNLHVVLHITCIDGKHCERGQYHLYMSCYKKYWKNSLCRMQPWTLWHTSHDGWLYRLSCCDKLWQIEATANTFWKWWHLGICLLARQFSIVVFCYLRCRWVGDAADFIFILDDDFDGGEGRGESLQTPPKPNSKLQVGGAARYFLHTFGRVWPVWPHKTQKMNKIATASIYYSETGLQRGRRFCNYARTMLSEICTECGAGTVYWNK